ncbi:MAG TPA: RNA-binding protein [Gammaproteobacteria bacterium]|nr:RNA-binding protein [Gammaproteobacteria bacterium]
MSTSLYVSNLSSSTTEEMLAGTFQRFGTVLSVKLKRDPETGRMHRYGFIEMKTAAEAQRAANGLNATRFDGRVVSVTRAARS